MMANWRASLLLISISLLALGGWYRHMTHQPQPPLPTIPVAVNGQPLVVEVARTEAQRRRGLMFRSRLEVGQGMLFVFEHPEPLTFWMKNTSLPLSIAFVGSDGHIVNIEDMQPFDTTLHHSAGPAMYALEVPQGWFGTHGVRVGDSVVGLPDE